MDSLSTLRSIVEISTSLGYTPDTITVDVYTPTEGINTPDYSSLSIFPNPFNHNVTIKFDDGQRIGEVNIINSQGKLVETHSLISSSTLNLSHLPKGVYFIEAISLIGLKSEVSILVKK